MLAVVLVVAGAMWFWAGKRKAAPPGFWLAALGAILGLILSLKGLPLPGLLLLAASAFWLRQGAKPGPTKMVTIDRADAAELLGIAPDADRATIDAAWRKLMARNHPDTGGSPGLAARINAARDLLLKSQ